MFKCYSSSFQLRCYPFRRYSGGLSDAISQTLSALLIRMCCSAFFKSRVQVFLANRQLKFSAVLHPFNLLINYPKNREKGNSCCISSQLLRKLHHPIKSKKTSSFWSKILKKGSIVFSQSSHSAFKTQSSF